MRNFDFDVLMFNSVFFISENKTVRIYKNYILFEQNLSS